MGRGNLVGKTSEGPAGTTSLGQDPQTPKVKPHVDLSGFQEAGDLEIGAGDTGSAPTHLCPLPSNFGMCES